MRCRQIPAGLPLELLKYPRPSKLSLARGSSLHSDGAVVCQLCGGDRIVCQRRCAELGGAGLVQLVDVDAADINQIQAGINQILGSDLLGLARGNIRNGQYVSGRNASLRQGRKLGNALVSQNSTPCYGTV
jgi:hypothetical protein